MDADKAGAIILFSLLDVEPRIKAGRTNTFGIFTGIFVCLLGIDYSEKKKNFSWIVGK